MVPRASRTVLTAALAACAGLALPVTRAVSVAAQEQRASAIYVSMCPQPVVGARCLDTDGGRLPTELTAVSPDGESTVRLTTNDRYEHSAVWAPDGEQVVFGVGHRGWGCNGRQNLHVMNVDGSQLRRITRHSFGCDVATDWSPNGRRILFDHECGLCFEVHSIPARGGPSLRLSEPDKRNDPDAYAMGGRWIKNGRQVIFSDADYGDDVFGIFRVRADGTHLRRLTPSMYARDPVVSPAGTHIAFAGMPTRKSPDRQPEVWVMRIDGSRLHAATDDARVETSIQWSPDGTTLAFESGDGSGAQHIATVGRDGSGFRMLQPVGMDLEIWREFDPYWSPDGSEIAVLGEDIGIGGDSIFAAYVVAADGSSYRRLTEFEEDLRVWGWEPLPQ